MQRVFLILFSLVVVVFGQTWVQRANLKNHTNYFMSVIQETVYELEKLGWCNLKLVDVKQNLNLQMYNLKVSGSVLYTNGFLVSVQFLDITSISKSVGATQASIGGTLNMRNSKLGYDVIANLTDFGEQRYTGEITLPLIDWRFSIVKNWNTEQITVGMTYGTSGGTSVRMSYRPENNITEAFSREFKVWNVNDGVDSWKKVMAPIMLDIVTNKIEYPEVCFSDC